MIIRKLTEKLELLKQHKSAKEIYVRERIKCVLKYDENYNLEEI